MATIIVLGKTGSGDIEAALRNNLGKFDHRIFQYPEATTRDEPAAFDAKSFLKPLRFPEQIQSQPRFSQFTAPRILLVMEPFIQGESRCGIYAQDGENFRRVNEYRCSDWCVVGSIWRELGKLLPNITESVAAPEA